MTPRYLKVAPVAHSSPMAPIFHTKKKGRETEEEIEGEKKCRASSALLGGRPTYMLYLQDPTRSITTNPRIILTHYITFYTIIRPAGCKVFSQVDLLERCSFQSVVLVGRSG